MLEVLEPAAADDLLVHWPMGFSGDEFFEELCRLNRDLRIECAADGGLIIMPPTYSRTGNRNFNLTGEVHAWSKRDGTGVGFDSSTGFTLPNGAKRSPDASWVRRERLNALTEAEKAKFLPLCPDVVFELRSATDSLADLRAKMREYIANGAQLGFLLDPATRRVYVYRADGAEEILEDPETVGGESVMPGFVLTLRSIWETDF
jgi:Uma2 family endonuclease